MNKEENYGNLKYFEQLQHLVDYLVLENGHKINNLLRCFKTK